MLRVRFHGRGGHGIKTASRILGTAAFRAGWQAQDAPVYGAERRGAPVTASTRIAPDPILERGIIATPDMVIVADETLIADPEAGVRRGLDQARGLFVNSPLEPAALARQFTITCPVVTLDLTSWAMERLGHASALSAALGAAACALTGFLDADRTLEAVREELEAIHVSAESLEKNLEFARCVLSKLAPLPARETLGSPADDAIVTPRYQGVPAGVPIIFAPGNTEQRRTGSWRTIRPVIDRSACTRCSLCIWRCPDGAMAIDGEGYPVVDYATCKGCLICLEECPIECIHAEREVRAW